MGYATKWGTSDEVVPGEEELMFARGIITCGVWVSWFFVGGCSEATVSPSPARERVIQEATPDEVLDHAAVILQREFGRVQINRGARRITTGAVEYTTARDSGTARDLVGGRSVMRRMATFDVGQRGDVTVARLRIDVERQDTARQTVMQPRGYRLTDTPGAETPVDRDAATSERQNTVWTRVRRDTTLEAALLAELQEYFARLTAEVEAAPPDTGPAAPAATAPATQPRP